MGKIIVFANQKGGVGKTTSAVNVAAAMGVRGKKTLLIDLDPQGNTSSGVGINKKSMRLSSYDVLIGRSAAESCVVDTSYPNLSVMPSNSSLYHSKNANTDSKTLFRSLRKCTIT